MKKITTILIALSSLGFSWTANHQWERGDTITWNVPYQSQKSFRNWTSACMPTGGAMIINFFYSGASYQNFNGANHTWNQTFNISNPYQTTGQRMYAQGIEIGQGGTVDTDLNNYLKNYPKSGINQYYHTGVNNQFGPLGNERWKWGTSIPPYQLIKSIQGSGQGLNTNLASYTNKKHSIISSSIPVTIQSIKNHLYSGPILISIKAYNSSGGLVSNGHILIIKGIDGNGNLIVNDPWGGSLSLSPGNTGKNATYRVNTNGSLSKNNETYYIKYAYHYNVRENFTRGNHPFSPYNIPVEANIKFHYDGSGTLNNSYDGDGDYDNIRNGFSIWNPQNNLKYYHSNSLGFLYTKTTIGDATNAVRWTPEFPKDGQYQVLTGFLIDNANSSNVNYTIYHTNGENRVSINQKNSTNATEVRENIVYKSLGSYCFDKGVKKEIGSVHLNNEQSQANKDINIDIMKFVYIGDCNTNISNKSIIDGIGSIIKPSNKGKWGSDRDQADMQKHSSSLSTVVFQWNRPQDTDSCKYLDIGILECANNSCGVSESKSLDVIIHKKAWSSSVASAYNTTLPITIEKKATWNTIAVTSQEPLFSKKQIVAICSKNIIHRQNKDTINNTNLQFESGYTWAGNSSIIRRDNLSSIQSDGVYKDVAIGLSDRKSVTLFQWQPSSNCLKLTLKSGQYPNGNGKSANINSVDIKAWDNKTWNLKNKCNGKLPCTIDAPNGAKNYYLIRVRANANAFDKNKISAVCAQ